MTCGHAARAHEAQDEQEGQWQGQEGQDWARRSCLQAMRLIRGKGQPDRPVCSRPAACCPMSLWSALQGMPSAALRSQALLQRLRWGTTHRIEPTSCSLLRTAGPAGERRPEGLHHLLLQPWQPEQEGELPALLSTLPTLACSRRRHAPHRPIRLAGQCVFKLSIRTEALLGWTSSTTLHAQECEAMVKSLGGVVYQGWMPHVTHIIAGECWSLLSVGCVWWEGSQA